MSQNQDQKPFLILASARADLRAVGASLDTQSVGKGVRFFAAARSVIDLLTTMPYVGTPSDFGVPTLHSMRYVRVKGFKSYLIFYRSLASKDGIVVHRVLHPARDVVPLLEESLDDSNQ